jgi:hypothetical protein
MTKDLSVLSGIDFVTFLVLNFSEFLIAGYLALRAYRRRDRKASAAAPLTTPMAEALASPAPSAAPEAPATPAVSAAPASPAPLAIPPAPVAAGVQPVTAPA